MSGDDVRDFRELVQILLYSSWLSPCLPSSRSPVDGLTWIRDPRRNNVAAVLGGAFVLGIFTPSRRS
jgi:hypothetical protein